jgi:ribulose-5-phosphate 4-epimerase/fuculose-1-phosphate aldolase
MIKPKHSPRVRGMDTMTGDMMIVVDLDGNVVEGDEIAPAEVFIHTEIYRARPDVMSVVHTHQPMSTLCGLVDLEIKPILHVEAPHVEAPVPTFACAELIVNQALGRGVAEALGSAAYCHLQGHGIVAVDRTVQEATLKAIHLERAAEANYRAAAIGRTPWVIPPDQINNLRQQLAAPAGRWAYYKEIAG